MSEVQSSSLDQFVVEVSRRSKISKNCRGTLEASAVTLAAESSSTSETVSTTPLSTRSTGASDYGSLAVISSALSVSTASPTIGSDTKSTAQQHFSITATTVDGKKAPAELYKPQRQAHSSATVILNRNTVVQLRDLNIVSTLSLHNFSLLHYTYIYKLKRFISFLISYKVKSNIINYLYEKLPYIFQKINYGYDQTKLKKIKIVPFVFSLIYILKAIRTFRLSINQAQSLVADYNRPQRIRSNFIIFSSCILWWFLGN